MMTTFFRIVYYPFYPSPRFGFLFQQCFILTGPSSGEIPFLTVRFLLSAAWRLVGCTWRTTKGNLHIHFGPRRIRADMVWLWATWEKPLRN